jgi:hypothetical protein
MKGTTLLRRLLDRFQDRGDSDLTIVHIGQPKSFASEYPSVLKPDPKLSPMVLVAGWVSGEFYGEEMPGLAADLFEAGYDSPALRRLAGEIDASCRADVAYLMSSVVRELGFPNELSKLQGRLLFSRQIAREVIAGQRDPWSASDHLEVRTWGWQADAPELQALFDLNDEINWDPPYIRPRNELDADLLSAFARLAVISDERILSFSTGQRSD